MKGKRLFTLLSFLIVLLLLNGCKSLSPHHTTNVLEQVNRVKAGEIQEVALEIETEAREKGIDGVLYGFQAGYYFFFMKDYERSIKNFNLAEEQIKEFERRAKVSARDVGSVAVSAVSSDTEMPYKGYGYEKIMLNTMLALNYLFKGDLEGAGVEIRKANLRQKEEQAANEEELKELAEKREEEGVDDKSVNSVSEKFKVLDDYSAQVINSFQNAFTYFISGVVYEINLSPDDAYIDFKKSYDLFKNRYTLEKLIELSTVLNFKDDMQKWNKLYRELYKTDPPSLDPKGKGELIVIHFSGKIPFRSETKIPVWLADGSINVTFPYYDSAVLLTPDSYISVTHGGKNLGSTVPALDFVPIVTKALQDDVPGMVTRIVLRNIAKNVIEDTASDELGVLGWLGAKIINTATEKADLRGWYELPRRVNVFLSKVPAGPQTFSLSEFRGGIKTMDENVSVNIREKGKTIVLVDTFAGLRSIHVLEI